MGEASAAATAAPLSPSLEAIPADIDSWLICRDLYWIFGWAPRFPKILPWREGAERIVGRVWPLFCPGIADAAWRGSAIAPPHTALTSDGCADEHTTNPR